MLFIIGVNDFSIIYSGKDIQKLRAHALLGPIVYVNHSCVPNCNFKAKSEGEVSLTTLRDIDVGEELTVCYSTEYFGCHNQQCLCYVCSMIKNVIEHKIANNIIYYVVMFS